MIYYYYIYFSSLFFLSLQIAYETLQFIVPDKHLMDGVSLSLGGTDPPFCLLTVVHVGLWVIIFVSDRVLQHLHHQSQAKGYLEFFRETKELRRFPYAILSIGMPEANVLMFIYFNQWDFFLEKLTLNWMNFADKVLCWYNGTLSVL